MLDASYCMCFSHDTGRLTSDLLFYYGCLPLSKGFLKVFGQKSEHTDIIHVQNGILLADIDRGEND
jgi:hypothetical protein